MPSTQPRLPLATATCPPATTRGPPCPVDALSTRTRPHTRTDVPPTTHAQSCPSPRCRTVRTTTRYRLLPSSLRPSDARAQPARLSRPSCSNGKYPNLFQAAALCMANLSLSSLDGLLHRSPPFVATSTKRREFVPRALHNSAPLAAAAAGPPPRSPHSDSRDRPTVPKPLLGSRTAPETPLHGSSETH